MFTRLSYNEAVDALNEMLIDKRWARIHGLLGNALNDLRAGHRVQAGMHLAHAMMPVDTAKERDDILQIIYALDEE